MGKRAHNLESLITIEGRDLDGNNIFNLKKLTPEFVRKRAASDRGLKIETHNRDHPGNGAGVIEEFRDGGIAQVGEAQQDGVIANSGGELRFGHCLGEFAADSGNFYDIASASFFDGKCEHGFKQGDFGIANRELCGVDADGKAAGTGR